MTTKTTMLWTFVLIFGTIIGKCFACYSADPTIRVERFNPVDLSGRNIRIINATTLKNWKAADSLNLSNNLISELSEHAFARFHDLRELYLNGNQINATNNAFVDVPHLEYLDISDNRLPAVLGTEFFVGFKGHTVIKIKNDRGFERITGDVFGGKKPVVETTSRTVSLHHEEPIANESNFRFQACVSQPGGILNRLDTLSTTGKLTPYCHEITFVNRTIVLRHISQVSSNALYVTDDEAMSANLSGLEIQIADFVKFPSHFVNNLPNYFQRLTVSNTLIEKLNSGALQHKGIVELDLAVNKIREIDPNAFKTPKLRKLILRENKLRRIALLNKKSLSNLTELNLGRNEIAEIKTNSFSQMKNLKKLIIDYNEISEIKEGAFKNLHNLEHIDLSHNLISDIMPEVFTGLENLRELSLSHNHLTEIRGYTYNLPKLVSFNVSNNLINYITIGSLQQLEELCRFDISHNPINKFMSGALAGLRKSSECWVTVVGVPLKYIHSFAFDYDGLSTRDLDGIAYYE